MNRDSLDKAYVEIKNFRDKLGEIFYDAVQEEDNTTYEIAKGIISVFSSCETQKDFDIADSMLTAVCGWNFESFVERIKERDNSGYCWKSY